MAPRYAQDAERGNDCVCLPALFDSGPRTHNRNNTGPVCTKESLLLLLQFSTTVFFFFFPTTLKTAVDWKWATCRRSSNYNAMFSGKSLRSDMCADASWHKPPAQTHLQVNHSGRRLFLPKPVRKWRGASAAVLRVSLHCCRCWFSARELDLRQLPSLDRTLPSYFLLLRWVWLVQSYADQWETISVCGFLNGSAGFQTRTLNNPAALEGY